MRGGGVASPFRNQRVRRFMAGGGEQKYDVGDEARRQELRVKIVHKLNRLGAPGTECKAGR